MVGMVLALIAVIVVMQIFQQSERNKRTTTGSSAASMDGAIAFTDILRDVRQGGMGMSNLSELGCSMTLRAGVTISNLGPVTINHTKVAAGDPNTDTLLVVYGSSTSSPEGDRVTAHASNTSYAINTPTAFAAANAYVVAAVHNPPLPCALVLDQINSNPGTTPGSILTTKTGSAGTADTLYDWGFTPVAVAYRVSRGRLQQCNYLVADCSTTTDGVWVDMVDGVISLRALYGRDTAGNINDVDGVIVDTYDQTAPASPCGWARTGAVKMALTMRSGQLETNPVTGDSAGLAPLPTWSGAASAPISINANSNWANYRYKVFESVVSMRNMSWIGVQDSCNGIF
jgi:type IV pilus assembly protein PilW